MSAPDHQAQIEFLTKVQRLLAESDFTATYKLRVRPKNGDESLAIDNMQRRPIKGTNAWTKAEIVLDVPANASDIMFGGWVGLKGKIWLDDLLVEIVDATVPTTDVSPWPDAPQNLGFEQRP